RADRAADRSRHRAACQSRHPDARHVLPARQRRPPHAVRACARRPVRRGDSRRDPAGLRAPHCEARTMTLNDALTLVLMLPLAAAWRMIVGPPFVDRVVAMDMLTGVAVAAAALTAATTQRREFLDVAFGV